MEEIELTHGQFKILLSLTPFPQAYTPKLSSLVTALHQGHWRGHKWATKMTEQDIETAHDLFDTHQRNVRTSAAQTALHFFVRDSPTARRVFDARREKADVPRETKDDGPINH